MDSEFLSAARAMRFRGVPVEAHESLGSTNDEAFRRAEEGAPQGLVVVAGHQTAGKGRLGRTWFDRPDGSLMFSILLKPDIPVPSYPIISLTLAYSIAYASQFIAPDITIKWPNDVLQGGRKFCGVLAESRSLGAGEPPVLVLGAGINVNYQQEDFPPELRGTATSLSPPDGQHPDRNRLLSIILAYFDHKLGLLETRGIEAQLELLETRMPSPGSPIRIVLPERTVVGEYLALTETGALRMRHTGTGTEETLTAGVMQ